MRHIARFIGRLFAYLPVIWKDEDWDYWYLLELIRFKISRMKKYVVDNGHHLNPPVESMTLAENIIKRILAAEYMTDEYEAHVRKWGGGVHTVFESQERDELTDIMRRADYSETQDWDMLFTTFKKHMRSWWD